MSNHVFISYARADGADFARDLHDSLEDMGLNMWLDEEDIPIGANWTLTIQRAIMTCRAFIFVITPASYESKVCNLELMQASDSKVPILPVYYKEVDVLPLLINDSNYVDCRINISSGFRKLYKEINELPEIEAKQHKENQLQKRENKSRVQLTIETDLSHIDDKVLQTNIANFIAVGIDEIRIIDVSNKADIVEVELPSARANSFVEAINKNTPQFSQLKFRKAIQLAKIFTVAEDIDELAKTGLFGRENEITQIKTALIGSSPKVLLQAFGGVGKTALAAEISANWIDEHEQAVLWLRMGASDNDATFEALAHPFGASKLMASTQAGGKAKVLRDLIKVHNIGLVVLDDCWNGNSLLAVQKGIPRNVPLLVTSRQDYPKLSIFNLPDLPTDDALALLKKLAPTLVHDEDIARALCAKLGNHAFAVEIAGRMMQAKNYTAQALLNDIKNKDITQLQVPLYQQTGRESIAALIETTLDALPNAAKNVFIAWRAFFSSHVTPELLRIYLEKDDIEDDLNWLQQFGLAQRQQAQYTDDSRLWQVASYRLHDLGFEYAQAQNNDNTSNRAVDTFLAHIERYKQPSLENFAALDPNIDTYMGASTFAMSQQRYRQVEDFVWNLYANETPQILVYRSYNSLALDLLQQAASAAKEASNQRNYGAHLGMIGLAYASLGQYSASH
ncbi:MAG: TIR domain-containing protein [Chloroflexota bacterium]